MQSHEAVQRLLDYGALGLVVLGLVWVSVRLWRELHGSWNERLDETREAARQSMELARAQQDLAEAMRARTDALRELTGCVRALAQDVAEVRTVLDLHRGRAEGRRIQREQSDEPGGAGRPP